MGSLAGPGVRVLLIGASRYEDSALPDLPPVTTTVCDLASTLHECCEVPREQIRTLLDPASIEELGDAVAQAAAEAEDVLVVYYAGHGQLDQHGDLYLATRATRQPRDGLEHRAFEYAKLRGLLRSCRAHTIVVILDCCFSGGARGVSPAFSDLEPPRSSGGYLLASAGPEELAFAPEGERHTACSGVLIRLLREGARSAPEHWTLERIFDFVERELAQRNLGRPHRVMTGHAGDLVLGRNAKSNPYPGLTAYGESDARFFFGREGMTEHMRGRLADQLTGTGLLVAVGASGSGKSSLLSAGLIPALRQRGLPGVHGSAHWPIRMFTPGAHPLRTLLANAAGLTGEAAARLSETLAADPARLTEAIAARLAGDAADRRMILVVDQFEEVFTACQDGAERVAFVTALLAAAQAGSALVVLGLRADFYPDCTTQPWQAQPFENQLIVSAMDEPRLRAVIERPAQELDLKLEAGLTERILRDLEVSTSSGRTIEAGVLPLLCYTLSALWPRGQGKQLGIKEYDEIGGIWRAVSGSAEECFRSLSDSDQGTARLILTSLVRLGERGTEDTRRQLRRSDLRADESTERVLREFTRQRLIIRGNDPIAGEETVEIAHVALTTAWPRLRDWLRQDREDNEARQLLEETAERWDRNRRTSDELLRGERLAMARTLRDKSPDRINSTGHAFVDASLAEERRVTRLRRLAVVSLCVVIVVVVGLVLRANQRAQHERDNAVFERITAQSDRLARSDASLAAQLTLTSFQLRPSAGLGATLIARANNSPLANQLSGQLDPFDTVAFSSDGQLLATTSQEHRIQLWRIRDQSRLEPLGQSPTGHPNYVNSLAFSSDGRLLASIGVDESIQLWSTADSTRPTLLHELRNADDASAPMPFNQPLQPGRIGLLAFSPDGRTLASASRTDQRIRLWDVTDPTRPAPIGVPLAGHQSYINALAFSPDGHTLASASADGTIRLWNTADPGQPSQELDAGAGDVPAITFSHDGRMLASAHDDRTIRLWNLTDPARAIPLGQPLTGHSSGIRTLAFAADDHALASVGSDRTVRLWHLPATVIIGHTGAVNALVFSADGRTLASGGADRTVRLWDVSTPANPVPRGTQDPGPGTEIGAMALGPDGHTVVTNGPRLRMWHWRISDPEDALHPPQSAATGTLAFGPDGRIAAVAGTDQSLSLWRVTGPTEQEPLSKPLPGIRVSYVNTAGFSHSGKLLAHASADRPMRLWNVADPARPVPLGPPFAQNYDGYVSAVAFSPDDRILATGSGLVIRLWDITNPAAPRLLGQPLIGHTGGIYTLAFSPDGRTLVSGGGDQTIRRWDITDPANPAPLGQPLIGHTGAIHALAFSPDSRILASAGADHTIRLWQLDVTQTIRRICDTTHNVLTEAAWREYVSADLPYRSACRS